MGDEKMKLTQLELKSEGIHHSLIIDGIDMTKSVRKVTITVEVGRPARYVIESSGRAINPMEFETTAIDDGSRTFVSADTGS
jgi:hypothetical protein